MACNHRNAVTIAIRNAKAEYINDELQRNKSNPYKFWRTIRKDILPDKMKNTLNLLDPQTNIPLNSEEIPSKINEYFSKIGSKLADSLPKVDITHLNNDLIQNALIDKFVINLIDIDIVIKYAKEISIYKSSGISNLGSRLLKDIFLYIPDILLDIFNKVLKIATVIPLPKVDNPKLPSELRPISLLPLIGKIMEKIIHNQLKSYLEENNLLTIYQHGFRKHHSTQSACAKFVDDIMLHLDRGDETVAVFLDIFARYTTV